MSHFTGIGTGPNVDTTSYTSDCTAYSGMADFRASDWELLDSWASARDGAVIYLLERGGWLMGHCYSLDLRVRVAGFVEARPLLPGGGPPLRRQRQFRHHPSWANAALRLARAGPPGPSRPDPPSSW